MKILRIPAIFFVLLILAGCAQKAEKNYIQYVDLLIGTGPATTESATKNTGTREHYGQTVPAVTAPFGMTQWTPQTHPTETKCISPFYWGTPTLQGFRATHWTSGSCVQDYGSFTVFPTVTGDEFRYLPSQRKTLYIFDSDRSSPAYYAAMLPENNILTEITATRRAGFFKFSWLDPQNATIIIDVNSDEGEGYIKIDTEKGEVYGFNPVHRIYNGHGKPAGFSGYFVAKFDKPFTKTGTFGNNELFHETRELQNKNHLGAYVTFTLAEGEALKMKMGTSFTSIENARRNLESEIPHWDFEKTQSELEKIWNSLLGSIEVEGGSDDDFTKFYTAMYHSLIHPRLFSDVNGEYPEFAGGKTVQKAEGFDYYCDFSNWDIFRAQMPLLSLVAPEQYEDMVKSLIVKAEQGGWLPIFPMWNSYTSAMIGDHSTSVIADALAKGFEFDTEKAYRYMRKNAFETPENLDEYIDGKGRRALDSYLQFGYIPMKTKFRMPSTVRNRFPELWNMLTMTGLWRKWHKKLGKTEDYNELMARSLNYANVFDPEKGWVCGRYGDGTFTDEFDAAGDMFYITEGTPKHYTWFVPHDVEGLMDLMGGKESFSQKLNALIDNREYWHGNEPSHQIPYLFNYADDGKKRRKQ
jgi:predicted alpha-1,2-mannosidase